jgi:CRP-like cAMP-binding protein
MSQQLEAVRVLRRVPIFSGLSDEEVFDILRICRLREVAAGTVLFAQGDPGDRAVVVESGTLQVLIDADPEPVPIAELGPGTIAGELALLDPGPRSATLRAQTDAVFYEITAADFLQMRQQMNPGAFKLLRALTRLVCQRLRTVNERLEAHLTGATWDPARAGVPDRASVSATPAAEAPGETPRSFALGLFGRLWKGGRA